MSAWAALGALLLWGIHDQSFELLPGLGSAFVWCCLAQFSRRHRRALRAVVFAACGATSAAALAFLGSSAGWAEFSRIVPEFAGLLILGCAFGALWSSAMCGPREIELWAHRLLALALLLAFAAHAESLGWTGALATLGLALLWVAELGGHHGGRGADRALVRRERVRPLVPAALSGILCVAIWFAVPWLDPAGRDADQGRALRRLTGFTSEVALGEFGRLENDDRVAMYAEIYDAAGVAWTHEDGAEARGRAPLLLRGEVLRVFDGRTFQKGPPVREVRIAARENAPVLRVEQRIELAPHGGPELFALAEPHAVGAGVRVEQGLCRALRDFTEPMKYVVYSSVPGGGRSLSRRLQVHLEGMAPWLEVPAGLSPAIAELAADFRSAYPATDVRRVQELEAWLQREGGFAYTRRDQNAGPDPLERFLFETRAGHCEYFAAAMVVLLRASGLPARMAVGYRGGTYDEREKRYRILRRHAHAWVEVPLAGLGWVAFDPTPGDDVLDAASPVAEGALPETVAPSEAPAPEVVFQSSEAAGIDRAWFFSVAAVLLVLLGALRWRGRRGSRAERVTTRMAALPFWARYRAALVDRAGRTKPSWTLRDHLAHAAPRSPSLQEAAIERLERDRFGGATGADPALGSAVDLAIMDLVADQKEHPSVG